MIVQTQTTSFKAELYEGIHDLLTDTIKIALYTAYADLDDFSSHTDLSRLIYRATCAAR